MISNINSYKIYANGVSSIELTLWGNLIKNILAQNKERIYYYGDIFEHTDKEYLHKLGIDQVQNTHEIGEEEKIIFLCLPQDIPQNFELKGNQSIFCFFGGISSYSIEEQLSEAKEKNITKLFSDLLFNEIQEHVSHENLEYFLDKQVFIPHQIDLTNNSEILDNNKDTIFIYNKSRIKDLDLKLLNLLKQYKNLKIHILDENNKKEWLKYISKIRSYKKILVAGLSVPVLHVIIDICNLYKIKLKLLDKEVMISPVRSFLNNNKIFEDLYLNKTNSGLIREKFNDILNFVLSNNDNYNKNLVVKEDVKGFEFYNTNIFSVDYGFCKFITEFNSIETSIHKLLSTISLKNDQQHPQYFQLLFDKSLNTQVCYYIVFGVFLSKVSLNTQKNNFNEYIIALFFEKLLTRKRFFDSYILHKLCLADTEQFARAAVQFFKTVNDKKEILAFEINFISFISLFEFEIELKNKLYSFFKHEKCSRLIEYYFVLDLKLDSASKEFLINQKNYLSFAYPLLILTLSNNSHSKINKKNKELDFLLKFCKKDQIVSYLEISFLKLHNNSFDKIENNLNEKHKHLFKNAIILYNLFYLKKLSKKKIYDEASFLDIESFFESDKILILCILIFSSKTNVGIKEEFLNDILINSFLSRNIPPKIKLECLILLSIYFDIKNTYNHLIKIYTDYNFRFAQSFKDLTNNISIRSKLENHQIRKQIERASIQYLTSI